MQQETVQVDDEYNRDAIVEETKISYHTTPKEPEPVEDKYGFLKDDDTPSFYELDQQRKAREKQRELMKFVAEVDNGGIANKAETAKVISDASYAMKTTLPETAAAKKSFDVAATINRSKGSVDEMYPNGLGG
ncbi:hypothetical protein FACS1894120_6650 [Clostridia bacterium]|nr:hypothetical protein FACS1894120_6650 [Clostridia bacterium]